MLVARISRFLLKSTLYFSAGLIGGALFLLLATSWLFVELLSPSSNNSYSLAQQIQTQTAPLRGNVEQLLTIGQSYIQELNVYNQLTQKKAFNQAAPLCDVICNESFFDEKQHIEQRGTYLNSFFQSWGTQALRDPQFLLTLAETETLNNLYSPHLRSTVAELAQFTTAATASPFEKLKIGLQIPKAGFLELKQWVQKEQSLKDWEQLRKLRGLRKSCHTQNLKTLQNECRSLTK